MATNRNSPQTLSKLLAEVAFEVNKSKKYEGGRPSEILHRLVGEIPREILGLMILEAGAYIDPFTVKSRIGFTSRYPESWEVYLRETLESVITGILSLDYLE